MNRPYHHGDLRSALLDAVGTILRESGVAGLSLREVARRAGVSHSAPAHHFSSKTALLTAYATQGYERLAEVVATERAVSPSDPPSQFEAIGRASIRFAIACPDQYELMYRRDLLDDEDPALRVASDAAWAPFAHALGGCVSEGRITREESGPIAMAAWGMVHGVAGLIVRRPPGDRIPYQDPEVLAASVCKLFVDRVLRR